MYAVSTGARKTWRRRAGDFRRFPSLGGHSRPRDFRTGQFRFRSLFRAALPPGKSRACDSKLASADGEMLAPREHVLAGRKIHDALARRAASGGSGLDGFGLLSERRKPRENALSRGIFRGVPGNAAAGT